MTSPALRQRAVPFLLHAGAFDSAFLGRLAATARWSLATLAAAEARLRLGVELNASQLDAVRSAALSVESTGGDSGERSIASANGVVALLRVASGEGLQLQLQAWVAPTDALDRPSTMGIHLPEGHLLLPFDAARGDFVGPSSVSRRAANATELLQDRALRGRSGDNAQPPWGVAARLTRVTWRVDGVPVGAAYGLDVVQQTSPDLRHQFSFESTGGYAAVLPPGRLRPGYVYTVRAMHAAATLAWAIDAGPLLCGAAGAPEWAARRLCDVAASCLPQTWEADERVTAPASALLLYVAAPPSGGTLSVSPATGGAAMTTEFELLTRGWQTEWRYHAHATPPATALLAPASAFALMAHGGVSPLVMVSLLNEAVTGLGAPVRQASLECDAAAPTLLATARAWWYSAFQLAAAVPTVIEQAVQLASAACGVSAAALALGGLEALLSPSPPQSNVSEALFYSFRADDGARPSAFYRSNISHQLAPVSTTAELAAWLASLQLALSAQTSLPGVPLSLLASAAAVRSVLPDAARLGRGDGDGTRAVVLYVFATDAMGLTGIASLPVNVTPSVVDLDPEVLALTAHAVALRVDTVFASTQPCSALLAFQQLSELVALIDAGAAADPQRVSAMATMALFPTAQLVSALTATVNVLGETASSATGVLDDAVIAVVASTGLSVLRGIGGLNASHADLVSCKQLVASLLRAALPAALRPPGEFRSLAAAVPAAVAAFSAVTPLAAHVAGLLLAAVSALGEALSDSERDQQLRLLAAATLRGASPGDAAVTLSTGYAASVCSSRLGGVILTAQRLALVGEGAASINPPGEFAACNGSYADPVWDTLVPGLAGSEQLYENSPRQASVSIARSSLALLAGSPLFGSAASIDVHLVQFAPPPLSLRVSAPWDVSGLPVDTWTGTGFDACSSFVVQPAPNATPALLAQMTAMARVTARSAVARNDGSVDCPCAPLVDALPGHLPDTRPVSVHFTDSSGGEIASEHPLAIRLVLPLSSAELVQHLSSAEKATISAFPPHSFVVNVTCPVADVVGSTHVGGNISALVAAHVPGWYVAGFPLPATVATVASVMLAVPLELLPIEHSAGAPAPLLPAASGGFGGWLAAWATPPDFARAVLVNRSVAVFTVHVTCAPGLPPLAVTCGHGSYGQIQSVLCPASNELRPLCGAFQSAAWAVGGCVAESFNATHVVCVCNATPGGMFAARLSSLARTTHVFVLKPYTDTLTTRVGAGVTVLIAVVTIICAALAGGVMGWLTDKRASKAFTIALSRDEEVCFAARIEAAFGRRFLLDREWPAYHVTGRQPGGDVLTEAAAAALSIARREADGHAVASEQGALDDEEEEEVRSSGSYSDTDARGDDSSDDPTGGDEEADGGGAGGGRLSHVGSSGSHGLAPSVSRSIQLAARDGSSQGRFAEAREDRARAEHAAGLHNRLSGLQPSPQLRSPGGLARRVSLGSTSRRSLGARSHLGPVSFSPTNEGIGGDVRSTAEPRRLDGAPVMGRSGPIPSPARQPAGDAASSARRRSDGVVRQERVIGHVFSSGPAEGTPTTARLVSSPQSQTPQPHKPHQQPPPTTLAPLPALAPALVSDTSLVDVVRAEEALLAAQLKRRFVDAYTGAVLLRAVQRYDRCRVSPATLATVLKALPTAQLLALAAGDDAQSSVEGTLQPSPTGASLDAWPPTAATATHRNAGYGVSPPRATGASGASFSSAPGPSPSLLPEVGVILRIRKVARKLGRATAVASVVERLRRLRGLLYRLCMRQSWARSSLAGVVAVAYDPHASRPSRALLFAFAALTPMFWAALWFNFLVGGDLAALRPMNAPALLAVAGAAAACTAAMLVVARWVVATAGHAAFEWRFPSLSAELRRRRDVERVLGSALELQLRLLAAPGAVPPDSSGPLRLHVAPAVVPASAGGLAPASQPGELSAAAVTAGVAAGTNPLAASPSFVQYRSGASGTPVLRPRAAGTHNPFVAAQAEYEAVSTAARREHVRFTLETDAAALGWLDPPAHCVRWCSVLTLLCGRHPLQKLEWVQRHRAAAAWRAAQRVAAAGQQPWRDDDEDGDDAEGGRGEGSVATRRRHRAAHARSVVHSDDGRAGSEHLPLQLGVRLSSTNLRDAVSAAPPVRSRTLRALRDWCSDAWCGCCSSAADEDADEHDKVEGGRENEEEGENAGRACCVGASCCRLLRASPCAPTECAPLLPRLALVSLAAATSLEAAYLVAWGAHCTPEVCQSLLLAWLVAAAVCFVLLEPLAVAASLLWHTLVLPAAAPLVVWLPGCGAALAGHLAAECATAGHALSGRLSVLTLCRAVAHANGDSPDSAVVTHMSHAVLGSLLGGAFYGPLWQPATAPSGAAVAAATAAGAPTGTEHVPSRSPPLPPLRPSPSRRAVVAGSTLHTSSPDADPGRHYAVLAVRYLLARLGLPAHDSHAASLLLAAQAALPHDVHVRLGVLTPPAHPGPLAQQQQQQQQRLLSTPTPTHSALRASQQLLLQARASGALHSPAAASSQPCSGGGDGGGRGSGNDGGGGIGGGGPCPVAAVVDAPPRMADRWVGDAAEGASVSATASGASVLARTPVSAGTSAATAAAASPTAAVSAAVTLSTSAVASELLLDDTAPPPPPPRPPPTALHRSPPRASTTRAMPSSPLNPSLLREQQQQVLEAGAAPTTTGVGEAPPPPSRSSSPRAVGDGGTPPATLQRDPGSTRQIVAGESAAAAGGTPVAAAGGTPAAGSADACMASTPSPQPASPKELGLPTPPPAAVAPPVVTQPARRPYRQVVQAEAHQQRAEAAHASGAALQALLVQPAHHPQHHHDLLLAEVAAATAVQRAWRRAKARRVRELFARVERFDHPPPVAGELASFVNPSRAAGSNPAAAAAAAAQPQRANARVVASLATFGSSALRRQGALGRR